MSDIETFGEAFPELILEIVADHGRNSHKVLLHIWNGSKPSTACRFRRGSAVYIPKIPTAGPAPLVRLRPKANGFIQSNVWYRVSEIRFRSMQTSIRSSAISLWDLYSHLGFLI